MMAYNESIQCILIRISFLALFCGSVRLNGALPTTKKVTVSLEFCLAFPRIYNLWLLKTRLSREI